VDLDNNGRTTAKHLEPRLAYKLARADIAFEATYSEPRSAPPNWKPTVFDLPPGGHRTLSSGDDFNLEHDHDVRAVVSGDWNLFLYGKISYKDILYIPHEFHFCGVYRQTRGVDPLRLSFCNSYNETD
jgi:hypothetical protein